MKNFIFVFAFLFAIAGVCDSSFAQSPDSDLKWNRWTTNNFVILSIDKDQGDYLFNNIENIKEAAVSKWGIKNSAFENRCKIMVVKDKGLFERMFRIDETRVEIRKNGDGSTQAIIWCLIDGSSIDVPISVAVSEAHFYSKKDYGCFWASKGMSLLAQSLPDIRAGAKRVNGFIVEDKPMYFGKSIFNINRSQYKKLSVEHKQLFDDESVLLCLMLRKEFGQVKFLSFIEEAGRGDIEKSLKVFGFDGFSDFDVSFKTYMNDVSRDVFDDKTPDSYLGIKAVSQ
jgi:hypothetical protein